MFGKSNSSIVAGSVTKGVSISHENASNSNPVINNNISINNNDSAAEVVHYDSPPVVEPQAIEQQVRPKNDIKSIQQENDFLKAILKIYINQKLYFNGKYIVCTPEELAELIKLITEADVVEIEHEPIEVSCLCNPKVPYSKVVNIWIEKDDQRSIFKYIYSNLLSLFDECKISLKAVRV